MCQKCYRIDAVQASKVKPRRCVQAQAPTRPNLLSLPCSFLSLTPATPIVHRIASRIEMLTPSSVASTSTAALRGLVCTCSGRGSRLQPILRWMSSSSGSRDVEGSTLATTSSNGNSSSSPPVEDIEEEYTQDFHDRREARRLTQRIDKTKTRIMKRVRVSSHCQPSSTGVEKASLTFRQP